MELAVRQGADRFVAAGAYGALERRLRAHAAAQPDLSAVVLSCFDRRTRMLPFVFYDRRTVPAGPTMIAAALQQAGITRTRAVFELWNPRFRPSQARLDGQPPQMLLVSSLQMHAQRAHAAIRDAWTAGDDRPLIIAGGPKAVYEPYHYWDAPGAGPRVAPDVVVTGEVYVLLELLEVVLAHRRRGERLRTAFERARHGGALDAVPGLVFLAPQASLQEPELVDTGLHRLVQDLDELPYESVGLGLLEPPHRRAGLSAQPLTAARVHRYEMIVSLLMTQGCKFNCAYCPIPALHQKSWRQRSPQAVAEAMRSVWERYGIRYFLGVDDNFFNRRETAEAMLTTLAGTMVGGRSLGARMRFVTEATQFDTYRNRDLLPLARDAGLHSIWFGIEDLTASLVNKGQTPERTVELFRVMHEHKISPMAMLMYHRGQPFYRRGSLYGLANQIDFLRRAGALTVHTTIHTPAVGTREYEAAFESGTVIASVGERAVAEHELDGNHVVVLGDVPPWRCQLQLWASYTVFYNPLNLLRALRFDGSRLRRRRIAFQLIGACATVFSAVRMLSHAVRLLVHPLTCHTAAPPVATLPVHRPSAAVPRYADAPVALRRTGTR